MEPTVIRFSEKDAVKSPYGDPKNIPFTDDNIIIITGGFMLTLQSSKSQILYLLIFKVKKDSVGENVLLASQGVSFTEVQEGLIVLVLSLCKTTSVWSTQIKCTSC